MSSVAWLSIVFLVAALVLPALALRDRRIPAGGLLRMGLIWLGIFVAVALLFALVRG